MKKLLAWTVVLLMTMCITLPVGVAAKPKQVLRVYNWGEYISAGDDGGMDVIAEFERTHPGVAVEYTTFASNEEMYAKIRSGSASYDVVIPSDYMVARMSDEGMLAELDFDNIPNISYIDDQFRKPIYDPEDKYSVPYTWGTVGLVYNAAKIDESPDSWAALWDERYAGKILMFDNPRDAFAIAYERLGYGINSTDPDQMIEAVNLLVQQKGVLRAYVMDQIFNKMQTGEAWIAPYYAGDATVMIEDNPDLDFVIPKEGSNIFVDAMCVLSTSNQKELAEEFINFMCEPSIMAENVSYIGYSAPSTAAKELLDEEVQDNPVIYPDAAAIAKCEYFDYLPAQVNEQMEDLWIAIKASDGSNVLTIGGSHVMFWSLMGGIVAVCVFLNVWIRVRKHRSKEDY